MSIRTGRTNPRLRARPAGVAVALALGALAIVAALLVGVSPSADAQSTGVWVRSDARIVGGVSPGYPIYESALTGSGGTAGREIQTSAADEFGFAEYNISWEAPPALMEGDETETLSVTLDVTALVYEGFFGHRLSVAAFLDGRHQTWTTFPFVDMSCTAGNCSETPPGQSTGSLDYTMGNGTFDGQVRTFQWAVANCGDVCSVEWDYTWTTDLVSDDLECDGRQATIGPDTATAAGRITGTSGDDVIVGSPGADIIDGLGGDDVICGKGGRDRIKGGPGSDRLFGGPGRDTIRGQAGRDRIGGGPGPDTIYGGGSVDRIDGDRAADTIFGEGGNDVLDGGRGNDRIFGNAGRDVIAGGAGDDRLHGASTRKGIGSDGRNILIGGDNDDRLYGGPDGDDLFGQDGDDRLFGRGGQDLLVGGTDMDRLDGGADIDICEDQDRGTVWRSCEDRER